MGDERSIHELKLFFFQTSFEWANALGVVNFISLPAMMDFCPFIPLFFIYLFIFLGLLAHCLCALFYFFLILIFNEVYYLSKNQKFIVGDILTIMFTSFILRKLELGCFYEHKGVRQVSHNRPS